MQNITIVTFVIDTSGESFNKDMEAEVERIIRRGLKDTGHDGCLYDSKGNHVGLVSYVEA